jgi:hypothetical protein
VFPTQKVLLSKRLDFKSTATTVVRIMVNSPACSFLVRRFTPFTGHVLRIFIKNFPCNCFKYVITTSRLLMVSHIPLRTSRLVVSCHAIYALLKARNFKHCRLARCLPILSDRMGKLGSAGRIFVKFYIWAVT